MADAVDAATSPPDVSGARHETVTIATTDAGPIDLHVLEAGDPEAPPVLLLHGWPQHAWCWRHVIPLLAGEHRLIAPDLRGFGWSDCPAGGYDPVTFAADAVALLDAMGVAQADVIGHDWGGSAAFALALTAPDRVRRMVILNTIAPWVEYSPALVAGAWRSWYAVVMAAAGDTVLRRRPQLLAEGIRRDAVQAQGMTEDEAMAYALRLREPARARASKLLYRTYLRALVGRGSFADLAEGRLTQRTLFLFGANDGAIAPAALRGVEDHGDDLTLEMVPDSGHFICEEKPELIADRARELFAG
jgi:pimeloyl-ACP methyl ester carboxylesterase